MTESYEIWLGDIACFLAFRLGPTASERELYGIDWVDFRATQSCHMIHVSKIGKSWHGENIFPIIINKNSGT